MKESNEASSLLSRVPAKPIEPTKRKLLWPQIIGRRGQCWKDRRRTHGSGGLAYDSIGGSVRFTLVANVCVFSA